MGVTTALDFHAPQALRTGLQGGGEPQRGSGSVALALALRPPAGWLVLASLVDPTLVARDDAGGMLTPLPAAPDTFFSAYMRNPFLADAAAAQPADLQASFRLPEHALQRVTGVSIAVQVLMCLETDLAWVELPIGAATDAVPGIPAAHLTLAAHGTSWT